MKKKLILFNVILTVVVLSLMFALGLAVTNSNNTALSEKKIKELTAVYCANYSPSLTFPADGDVRVTVIDETGAVIKDSLKISDENHLYRDEIEAAANGHPTVYIRNSDTLGKEMMYYAEKVQTDTGYVFVRVAIPTESIRSYAVKSVAPMIAILLGVWLCSVVASILLSGVLLKPLKQVRENLVEVASGTYRPAVPATGDPDINSILSAINDLSEKLQNSMLDAQNERRKSNYVLSNVTDGIAVFDKDLNLVIANESLKKIFSVTAPEGKHAEVLTADPAFLSALSDCAEKKTDAIFPLETEGRYFLCTARYTDSTMIVAVLSDVTQTKESEKMRLEFFANASHELKTPLTTVKGFNDMISLQTTDSAIADYSARIGKEIDRITRLLDDMLDLSKLENTPLKPENLTQVSLREIAEEVKEELTPLCRQKNVQIFTEGEGSVNAEREHIFQLIKNLAENGVRYNSEGGNVQISISADPEGTSLSVSDNGIGIDAANQSRIFERFYRVDKSRSRATGGTGLGLAIVKHICELYGAKLTLKSKLGDGTTVLVRFPI